MGELASAAGGAGTTGSALTAGDAATAAKALPGVDLTGATYASGSPGLLGMMQSPQAQSLIKILGHPDIGKPAPQTAQSVMPVVPGAPPAPSLGPHPGIGKAASNVGMLMQVLGML